MSFYHTDEKFKVLDSKPIYESCQATIDLKKDSVNIAPSTKDSCKNTKLIENILGIDETFYQR